MFRAPELKMRDTYKEKQDTNVTKRLREALENSYTSNPFSLMDDIGESLSDAGSYIALKREEGLFNPNTTLESITNQEDN